MPIAQSDVKKIDSREWNEIRSRWFNYFPVIFPPGSPPGGELYENQTVIKNLPLAKLAANRIFLEDDSILRQDIFRECIFLLHKANNVCCATLNQVENGILSWSISGMYQSSFFAMKSILGILGVSLPQVGMHHLLIDAFPEDEALTSKEKKARIKPKPLMKFIHLGTLNHKDHWTIFQRLLRITKVPIWSSELVKFLIGLDTDEFSKARNDLHYKSNNWPELSDLFERQMLEDYACFDKLLIEVDPKSSYINLPHFLNFVLIKLAFELIEDLSKDAPIVKEEFDLMKKRYSDTDGQRIMKSVSLF